MGKREKNQPVSWNLEEPAQPAFLNYLLELTNERAFFLKWISPSGVGGVKSGVILLF